MRSPNLRFFITACVCWLVATGCKSEPVVVTDAGSFDLPPGAPGCDAYNLGPHPGFEYACVGTVGCVSLPMSFCSCACTLCENGRCVEVSCDDSCLNDAAPPTPPPCDPSSIGQQCSTSTPCPSPSFECLLTADGGVCACICTPDDPSTPVTNEDTCPNQPQYSCRPHTDGGTKFYCKENPP